MRHSCRIFVACLLFCGAVSFSFHKGVRSPFVSAAMGALGPRYSLIRKTPPYRGSLTGVLPVYKSKGVRMVSDSIWNSAEFSDKRPASRLLKAFASKKSFAASSGADFRKFFHSNWLIFGEILVIALAWCNPAFGATGGPLKPEFTISKVAVFLIFFINGIALEMAKDEEGMKTGLKTNSFIQFFNFIGIPLITKLLAGFYPNKQFTDGLLILSCLPCTINISVAQTLSAGGDMGTAIFNAIFGNVIGVFLTPLLSIWMLGSSSSVSLLTTLRKLGGIVILPLALGQLLRPTKVGEFMAKNNTNIRTFSSCLLLAIVYNIFSDTFKRGFGVSTAMLCTLAMAMPALYLFLTAVFYMLSKKLLPGLDAQTRGAAMLISSSKTLAFGVPFIKTALGHRADIAYILAPLLLYAPAQLLLGSSVVVPIVKNQIAEQQNLQVI